MEPFELDLSYIEHDLINWDSPRKAHQGLLGASVLMSTLMKSCNLELRTNRANKD